MTKVSAGALADMTCSNCIYAKGRHSDPAAELTAAAAGHPIPRLHCYRYPKPEPKRDDDWCGEHHHMGERRDKSAADAVAWAVSRVLAASLNPPVDAERLHEVAQRALTEPLAADLEKS